MTRKDALAALLLFVIVLAAYGQVRKLWWTYDDAYLIHTALTHSPRSYFFSRSFWREVPFQMFVPFLFTTYDGVSSISGPLNARLFYTLELIALGLTIDVSYFAFRLWLKPALALTASTMLALGAPVCAIATQLMASPYILSMALSLLALIAFQKRLSTISVLAYFGAALAKEIAFPLPAVLALLPDGSVRERIRRVIPHCVAAAIYLLWRRAMIGTFLGGYGWAVRRENLLTLLVSLPKKLMSALAGPELDSGTALLVVTGAFIVAAFRLFPWRAIAALSLSIAPIIPVSREMQSRFALAAWICWVSLFIAGVARANLSSWQRGAACALAVMLAVAVNRAEWSSDFGRARRMSEEARAFFSFDSNSALRDPLVPPAAMAEFKWLKEDYAHAARGSSWFYDDAYLCSGHAAGKRLFQFQAGRVSEINAAIARSSCGSIRTGVPLAATFHHESEILSWHLGPYSDGSWRLVVGDGTQAYDVPRSDAFHVGNVDKMALKVKYTSPQGWITYSPELTLNFAQHADYIWRR